MKWVSVSAVFLVSVVLLVFLVSAVLFVSAVFLASVVSLVSVVFLVFLVFLVSTHHVHQYHSCIRNWSLGTWSTVSCESHGKFT